MFKIYDGREAFYQWDINQKLIVDDDSITEVHFSNRTNSYSLVCDIQNEGNLRVVSVPNVLLQTNLPIIVYAYRKDHTEVSETFKVIEKDKPEDYIYTPDEVKTWEELNNRITELEQSESVLYTAQELTEEQKAQARQNIGAQDENNGLTPVTVTYINPFYNTTDTSTTYLLQGTLKVFDDNSPTDVKKAFAIVMNILGGHATPTGTAGCRDLFDKFRILYDNGLITIPFKAYPNKYDRNYWVSLSAYQNKYIFFNCVRSDKADGFNVTLRYDLETSAYVEQSCYSEQAVKSSLKGLTGTPTILQVQMQSDPTADKEIATKHYVDNSIAAGSTDISLGLTSASVGQTIKVKAVDESGKPTAWEAAEEKTLKWIKVHESTLTENTNIISVSTDESGKELQEYNPIGIALVVSTPADATQTNNNGLVWAYPKKDMGDNEIRVISTIASWKTVNRDSIWIWQGGSTALAYNGNNNGALPTYKMNNYAMNGVYAYIPDTKDHFPVGSTVLVSVLTEK